MSLKSLKFSGIAAAVALGLGLSSMAQAAVVVVTGHRPQPPPVYNCVYKPYNHTVICYRPRYPARVFYATGGPRKVCMNGRCYLQRCFVTYNGKQCYLY